MALSQSADAVDDSALSMDSAAQKLAALYGDDDEIREEEDEAEIADEDSDQSEETDDIEVEEDDEPETPAIEPPARLSAELKEKFASLPTEAQAIFAEIELQRNQEVTKVTTRAAEAQRQAEAVAAQADANAKAVYVDQLRTFAKGFEPQAPDYTLAEHDPASFIAQNARYQAAMQRHTAFVSQIEGMGQEVEQTIDENFIAERDRRLLTLPEVANVETRSVFFDKTFEAAKALNIKQDVLDSADADDFIALRQIADWKADAEKYRAALAKNMQKVREGKNKPVRSTSTNQGTKEASFKKTEQRFKQKGDVKDAATLIAQML